MSQTEKYLRQLLESRAAEIHTAMPCKVESFDESTGTAKVVPLFMTVFSNSDTPQQKPPLLNVPTAKRKYKSGTNIITETPYYETGDIVMVVFLERAYDFVRNGNVADPKYNRKHALDDGIIIGLL